MENNKVDNIMLGDKTLKQWEEQMNAPSIPSNISFTDAEALGLMSPEDNQPQQQENKFYDTLDTMGIEHPDEGKQYQQLSRGESWKDAGLSLLAEASHLVVPKSMEWNYEAKTRFGENVKYGYRYIAGTAGFMYGGGIVAGIKGLANAGKIGKGVSAIAKFVSGKDIIKTGANASKLAKIGTRAANATLGGSVAGAMADFTLYRPEENEGHLADAFGHVDNALISYLQTDENDTDLDAKLKNVVEGFFIGMGAGNIIEFAGKPLFKRIFKNFKALKDGKEGAVEAVIQDQVHLERFAKTADLVEEVKKIKAEAETNGQEASQLLIDRLHPEDNIEAQKMLKVLDEGDEIFPHSDGTWDREVRTWDEAHKVSPEEFKKQLLARDEAAGGYAGDTAISYQDKAVKDTWTNRGWIGENESLITETKTGKKANTSIAKNIVKNYQDKWQIDNKVKVEFVDGLTIKGQAVEGNTSATKYQGKTTKTNQNAIDKKKLQIQKIEDKITMAEGGNTEVTDPLDILKEELRIAKNELKELQKAAKGTNKIPDITIQIDVNAKNPYATLRAELEHARDIAKGEVPNQSEKHFSRYDGLNEGEVAPDYVYKKAQGKAKATSQSFMNDGQTLENGVKYNQETIDESTRTNNNIPSRDGNRTETSNDGLYGTRPSESDGGVRPFIRRSEVRSSDAGGIIHDPSPEFKTELEAQGKPINSYKELAANSDEDAASFIAHFRAANEVNGKNSAQVYEYTPEEYKQMRLFTAENGKSGFALKPDGDVVSVFSAEKGSLAGLMKLAIQNGGNKLDCFDTFLPKIYKKFGFIEVDRVKWNEEYKPANWDKEHFKQWNNGEPDVVYMKLQQTPPTPIKPQQLKLDFSQTLETKQSAEEITNGLVNGEVKPTTKADLEAMVSKVEQLEPDISGFKFENLTKDAEGFVKQLEEIFDEDDVTGLLEAFAKGDIDTLEYAVRKQMTAVHIIENIKDSIKNLGDDATPDVKVAAIQATQHLGNYITEIKSGFGRGLNSQKLVNSTLESYGASRLSSWTKEGIGVYVESVIDAINNLISLNFTRGRKLVEEVYRIGLENPNTREFTRFLTDNDDVYEYFASQLDKLAKARQPITKEQLEKAMVEALAVPEYNAMFKASQLASDNKTFMKTIKNWMDGNGGITSYYVHNLLSGVGSLAKNIGSGIVNTVYFPAKKILASYDMFLDAETRTALRNEGWRTYKNMKTSWDESWQLMKEAFISGNGKLTDIGENTLNMDEGQFKGFHEWKIEDLEYYQNNPKEIWTALQNFHSVMTRAMGATDELMSQLNYRSIVRSKALAEAEAAAVKAGTVGDEAWINGMADEIFNGKFDQHGKPLDVEALNEARTILYQNNLDGTMYDYLKKKPKQMREQTFVMQIANSLQVQANKHWFVKLMFPFVKTGTNILQMALDHNGLYMALSPSNQKTLFSKTREGALARSQVGFGMFSLAVGSLAALNGFITGSAPTDPQERKALFATGWKPYSIKVGDTYISYQGYEPLHGMLGFAADCANMWSTVTNPEDEMRVKHFTEQMIPALINNFLDKAAFRTGLKQLDLIMNPKDTDEWAKAMAQTAKGFLPNVAMVNNLNSIGEHDVMQPKTPYERVFYRYFPNLWQPKDYRRNVFGEKQSITHTLITSVAHQDGSPEEEALEYLAQFGYTPSEIDDVMANTGLKISQFKDSDTGRSALDAMKEEMSTVTIQGRTLREAVRDLVTSEEYQLLPDGVDLDTGTRWGSQYDTKINAINDIFLMYKQRAKKNIMNNSEYFVDSEGRTMDEAKEEIKLNRLQQLNNLY